MKEKFLKSYLTKWRRMSSRVHHRDGCDCEFCYKWANWPNSIHEESSIPRDVPKGHLVVYVGENYKRFVIKITLLKHPVFKALLDRAQDEYGFATDSKPFLVMKVSSSMSFVVLTLCKIADSPGVFSNSCWNFD